MHKYKVIVIPIAQPLLIGIYQDNNLVEIVSNNGKTSDILPSLFAHLLKKYAISEIYYVNGPGSYMAIKVAYIFLKTLSIVQDIALYAVSGFDFNKNSPIKALGKKYFFRDINNKSEITIDFLKNQKIEGFNLPKKFVNIAFHSDTLPEYNLPAV